MLLVKKVKKNEDGTMEAVFSLTEEQTAFLISYAISALVAEGVAQVEEIDSVQ